MSQIEPNITHSYCQPEVGEEGDLLQGQWYIGVTLSVFASVISNLGMNIQKYSMIQEHAKVKANKNYKERAYIFQPLWIAGFAMVTLGAIGDMTALAFAAQSLATPVGGLTMVANVFFAHYWLKEPLTKRDLFATFVILVGVVMVAISADKTEKHYNLECLLERYVELDFVLYVMFIGFLLIGFYIVNLMLRRMRARAGPKLDSEEYRRWKKIHPICPSALSGLAGAQSVLFAKCTAELFKVTFEGENQFDSFAAYLIIVAMFLCIASQIHWLAMALKHFDAVIVVPVFQCFFITGSIIGGGVFFEEFDNLEMWELALFSVGVILTLFGVYVLAQREQRHPELEHTKSSHSLTGTDDVDGANSSASQPKIHPGSKSSNSTKLSLSIPDGEAGVSNILEDDTEENPRLSTPVPMSLQHNSLAVSDVFNAIRDGLSERSNSSGSLNSRTTNRNMFQEQQVEASDKNVQLNLA